MDYVTITITATVTTTVKLAEGETKEDLLNRNVDIYLHDHGIMGDLNKRDLGADKVTITIN